MSFRETMRSASETMWRRASRMLHSSQRMPKHARTAKVAVAPAETDNATGMTERPQVPRIHHRKGSNTSHGTQNGSLPNKEHEQYTRAELKEFRQLFSMFDTDGSGAIGNEELKQAMISMGMAANDAEIDNVDADGNGEIDFEEFCACMKKSQRIVKTSKDDMIRECFEIFDQDKNGVITENEFKYVAKEVGGYTDELAEKVFRELDVSSIGHLSADQFAAVVEEYLLSEPSRYEMENFNQSDSDADEFLEVMEGHELPFTAR